MGFSSCGVHSWVSRSGGEYSGWNALSAVYIGLFETRGDASVLRCCANYLPLCKVSDGLAQ